MTFFYCGQSILIDDLNAVKTDRFVGKKEIFQEIETHFFIHAQYS